MNDTMEMFQSVNDSLVPLVYPEPKEQNPQQDRWSDNTFSTNQKEGDAECSLPAINTDGHAEGRHVLTAQIQAGGSNAAPKFYPSVAAELRQVRNSQPRATLEEAREQTGRARMARLTRKQFDGETFSARQDGARLTGQLARVRDCMADGKWRTLDEIKAVTGDQTQAISARLRDLRKPKFGGRVVERRRRGEASLGIWEYRVEI